MTQIPKKLIIIGSGYIGLEFACIFGNLGTEVHVMFRGEKPLTGFDDEVCSPLSAPKSSAIWAISASLGSR